MASPPLLGTWPGPAAPPLLLIVREQIRPGGQVAYDRIEAEIRRVCLRGGCPNAYIALTAVAAPVDVWWLTAWASQEELDQAGALYAANAALAARLGPLNARKRALTDEPANILARAVGAAPFTLAGARFLTVTFAGPLARMAGAPYDLPDGRRIVLAPSAVRPSRLGPDSVLLAIRPKWSLPPEAFARADPDFWGAGGA
jgi:hypothetical protein